MSAAVAKERRSRERIGADTARVWARELDLRNPYAKAILLAIANYMNEDGAAWPGTATIARDTDISEDTVVRRLRWLESIGAIALLKRWKDENGRCTYDGRGKPTSNEIRFLFDADKEELEARARGEETTEESDESRPRPERGLESASPRVAPEQPPQGEPAHIEEEELEQEVTPLTPQGGNDPLDLEFEKAFERFRSGYPIPIINLPLSRQLFGALSSSERDTATSGAEAYARFCKAEKRRALDAHRFIRDRKWEGFVGKGMPASAKPRVFVEQDSAAWNAWKVFEACYGRALMQPTRSAEHGTKVGWWFEGEYPPFGQGLDPNKGAWIAIAHGSQQWWSWQERLKECRGVGSPSRMLMVDGNFTQGWEFPLEWPPAKHPREGPQSMMTKDDERELASSGR